MAALTSSSSPPSLPLRLCPFHPKGYTLSIQKRLLPADRNRTNEHALDRLYGCSITIIVLGTDTTRGANFRRDRPGRPTRRKLTTQGGGGVL